MRIVDTLSVATGFLSFLAHLGDGYLDTWHGVGTALLLPVFVVGLVRTRRLVGGGESAAPCALVDFRTSPAGKDSAGNACLPARPVSPWPDRRFSASA